MSDSAIGFITSPTFVRHALPPSLEDRIGGHPERPDRIRAVWHALQQAGMISSEAETSSLTPEFGLEPSGPSLLEFASPEPCGDEPLLLVHPQSHLDRIARLSRQTAFADAGETYVGSESDAVARTAVACGLAALDAVMNGRCKRAFAAVRPPGHHAEPDRAMGFCLYSNVAVGVKAAQQKYGLKRIAVLDFDVHHGNGTQAVFYDDPTVLTVSLHGSPSTLWPGTGYGTEQGAGEGFGTCLNIPVNPGTTSADYIEILQSHVLTAVDHFAPEFLFVSAGFDAHRDDPLASLMLDEEGFHAIGRLVRDLGHQTCDGRTVCLLEGGYNLRALGRSVVWFLRGLSGDNYR